MKLTINKDGQARKMKHAWHLVDWDQPTSVICEQMGVTQGAVSRARSKYASETLHGPHVKKSAMKDRWAGIDWTKSDWVIGKEIGRPHGSVWKTRRLLFQHNAQAMASADTQTPTKETTL